MEPSDQCRLVGGPRLEGYRRVSEPALPVINLTQGLGLPGEFVVAELGIQCHHSVIIPNSTWSVMLQQRTQKILRVDREDIKVGYAIFTLVIMLYVQKNLSSGHLEKAVTFLMQPLPRIPGS